MLDRLLPALLFLTGAAGLVYEVVVARLLGQHLGSSGASQAVTLATFLGGLSLGAVLAGKAQTRWLATLRSPLAGYAVLEAAIGLWALLLPMVAEAVFAAWGGLAAAVEPGSAAAVAVKMAIAATLLLPLATAMGATLPALAVGLRRTWGDNVVTLIGRYYAINAAGAAAGALLAGFWLIEKVGLELPLTLGACVNFGVAFAVWRASPLPAEAESTQSEPAWQPTPVPTTLLAIALITGAVALCSEVLWTRLASLLLGASTYSFALMLAVAIAGIAMGSGWAVRALVAGQPALHLLATSQFIAGVAALVLVARSNELALELAVARSRLVPVPENYAIWLVGGGGWFALHLFPAAFGLGAVFPALLAAAHQAGCRADAATARLLAANTAGNLLGALGGGFVLMPVVGVEGALAVCGAVSLGLGAWAQWPEHNTRALRWPLAAVVCAGLWFAAFPPQDGALSRGLFRLRAATPQQAREQIQSLQGIRQVFRHDGKDATIVVDQYPDGLLIFRTNGKADGGTGDAATQLMLGHLGPLLHPAAKQALVIGLGTGQTAAALVSHAGMQVHAVELSAAVVQAAGLFSKHNDDVLHHPRLKITVADAREVLHSLPAQSLDLVVSEPSNPWIAGIADLYTAQAFERVRDRLRGSGLLVQWIHTYEMSDASLQAIVCTLHGVFAHVAVFRMDPGDLALVASATPLRFDADAAAKLLQQAAVVQSLRRRQRPEVPVTIDQFLITQLAGPSTVARLCQRFSAPLQEKFPRLEYTAPRDFFAGTSAARFVKALDTRVTAAPDTFFVAHLAAKPLDVGRRAALSTFLLAGHHGPEQALVAATTGQGQAPAGAPLAVALAAAVTALQAR
ncbi:MAG: hypothetical protein EXR77_10355 [Myxococcales bacterium]|nr:hypothetical protein [Myxococcales bacterium]